MVRDDLGDRCKYYESINEKQLINILPICVRIDGRSFHTFCRGLRKPFDIRLSNVMRETTKWLVGETNACIGYTQSDEITLVYYSENYNSQVFFNGNHQKMVSTLSALTTLKFYQELDKFELGYKQVLNPHFDCRVWNVPNKEEAANLILWRENDATRNSIQMAVRSVYSQKEIQNKNCSELQEMLFQKGINWNDYPVFFKRGSYFQRVVVKKKYTIDEIDKLPLKHAARSNKNLVVERSEIVELKLPIFAKIENRVDIIFKGDII